MLFDFLTNNLQESFLIPLIGLLLATFLYKSISYSVRDPKYSYFSDFSYLTTESDKTRKMREEINKAEDNKVFTYSMFAGVFALILGIYGYLQSSRNPRMSAPSRGIALGGFFLILYNILINWYQFQEGIRIAVLGLSFLALTATAFWSTR